MKNTKTNKTIAIDPMDAVIEALENCANIVAQVQAQNVKHEQRIYTLECELSALNIETPVLTPVSRVKIPAMFSTAPKVSSPAKKAAKTVDVPNTFDEALTQATANVRRNMKRGVYNDKIMPQGQGTDYRVYLPTTQHRPFKLAAKAAGIPLIQAVEMLADAIDG